MLKNYRLIATVLVFAASSFGAFAQTNQTDNYKDVLLNGKPAILNLITGEVTYANGEIAKSRAAKKIKDSLLNARTEIKTNLLKDMVANSESTNEEKVSDSIQEKANEVIAVAIDTDAKEIPEMSSEINISNAVSEGIAEDSITTEETPEVLKQEVPSDFHVVEEGDNLYYLSKRYKTTLKELMIANKLQTTLIKPGQYLRIRNFDFSEAEITWTVSKGDTLYSIAKKNNTTVDELKDINGLSNSLIKIGQKLQVNQNSTLTKK